MTAAPPLAEDGPSAQVATMAEGVIAHVPNEKPRFVPIAAGILSCGIAEVAVRVRRALRAAVFGEADDSEEDGGKDEDEEQEEDDFRLLFREKDLEDERCASLFLDAMSAGRPCVVRVLFRLLGGKGGFGALLRGQKGRGKKTTNMDSMRDLSGRRLRHSKAVERIKEWMEKHKQEDELVAALTGEGPELPKPVPKAESLDPEYVSRLKGTAAGMSGLVGMGMRRLREEGAAAGEEKEEEEAPKAKRRGAEGAEPSRGLDPLSMLEGLSSEEDGEEEAAEGTEEATPSGATASSASSSGAAAASSAAAAGSAASSASSASAGAVEADEDMAPLEAGRFQVTGPRSELEWPGKPP
eukprot:CAMPEP_0204576014 /NCGR_PEP_ID=MMETSP0661-20131031/41526_1 /ASSEMBLY_ACC=CAM_ASM_000606 /TAXON_ID=109239 /ORGANISM="Alexandrium margalefi, Strain AMGDE01CS-322" /LENGTH=353 /DNA_ID=CAMNT_0051584711 /DNA_START=35 /DNA_END=1094 /DNA_ORIENTATION=+